jgi:hypothetical protein
MINDIKNNIDKTVVISVIAGTLATSLLLFGLMKTGVKPIKTVAKAAGAK